MTRRTATAEVDDDDAAAPSQTVRALLRLRELIVSGRLRPGERVAELTMVDKLGMSRTPIRTALVRLQDEGLISALPSGGFMVRDFSEADIRDAIELRGTLEGLAARLAAERGAGASLLAAARDCVERIDSVLAPAQLSAQAFSIYVDENARFHRLLGEMSGSALVQRQIERASTLPFASPNAFVMVHATGSRARDRLVVAHEQHRSVLAAIRHGEGARAQALMQEHARNAHVNLADALQNQQAMKRLPGASLIRRGLAEPSPARARTR